MPSDHMRPKMFHAGYPRRFLPPSPDSHPLDLFTDQADCSANGYRRYFHRQDDTAILVFTDGACLDQGKPEKRRGGWGVVYNGVDPGLSGSLEGTVGGVEQTSNRAELRAVIAFLQMRVWEAGGANKFVIATDSEYVVEGICDRLDRWMKRGWKTSAGTPVANRDLWEVLKREIDSAENVGVKTLFWRIPREFNERADRLAKAGADSVSRIINLGQTNQYLACFLF